MLISYFVYICVILCVLFFFFKQETAYEMRISDWSSYVCSSDLMPDGDIRQQGIPESNRSGLSVRVAVRSQQFIGLYVACLICSFGVFVPFVHLVPYALDQGIAQSTAVLLLGAIGAGSTAGRFFLGEIADRMGRRPFQIGRAHV